MAKRPLLWGELGKPAAALLLFVMLLPGFSACPAFAEGEGARDAPRALDGAPPAAGKSSGEAVKQPKTEDSPKETSSGGAPATAKVSGTGPDSEAARLEDKDATAEAATTDKPAGASVSAPAAIAREVMPAGPKDTNAETKPAEAKAAENSPAPTKPAETKETLVP